MQRFESFYSRLWRPDPKLSFYLYHPRFSDFSFLDFFSVNWAALVCMCIPFPLFELSSRLIQMSLQGLFRDISSDPYVFPSRSFLSVHFSYSLIDAAVSEPSSLASLLHHLGGWGIIGRKDLFKGRAGISRKLEINREKREKPCRESHWPRGFPSSNTQFLFPTKVRFSHSNLKVFLARYPLNKSSRVP